MKKSILLLAISVCFIVSQSFGQMKIGASTAPVAASVLELESSTQGFVLPRVSLTNITSNSPLGATILTSTIVYNTNASVTGGSGAGIYYWDGIKWNFIANATTTSAYWSLAGNGGTTPGTNFLGTTDYKALEFKVNNQISGYLDPANAIAVFGRVAGNIGTASATGITAFGSQALKSLTSGANNTAIGDNALGSTTTGASNVAVGYNSLAATTTASGNTGVGYSNLIVNTGALNTSLGYLSLNLNTSGSNNAGIGQSSLKTNTTGNNNTALGSSADVGSGTLSNATAIGANAYVTQNNSLVLGSINATNGATANTNVGIGTTAPAQSLEIGYTAGTARIAGLKSGNSFNSSSTNANSTLLYANNSTGDIYALPTANNAFLITSSTGVPSWSTTIFNNAWQTTGNGGTTPGTNFLGTTDYKALEFKVNNQISGYLDPANAIAVFGRVAGNIGTASATGITAFGSQALKSLTSGANNTAIGDNALGSTTTGASNVAVGYNSLAATTTASGNTGVGYSNLIVNTGALNTSLGYLSLNLNTSGSNNAGIGQSSLKTNTTGNNNTALGSSADVGSGTLSNATAIGANAYVTQNNSLVLGSINATNGATANTNVGIGTTAPAQSLEIGYTAGTARIAGLKSGNSFNSSSTNANSTLLYANNSTGDIYALPTANNAFLITSSTGVPSWSTTIFNNAWQTLGNAGTTSATNFLGTTDNNGLAFRTNNAERMHIDSLGNVAIGSTAYDLYNRERLLVDYGTTTSNTLANMRGKISSYLQLNIQNTSSDPNASTDIVATADNGTDSTNYVDLGINSSTYAPSTENWGSKNDAYLYSYSRNFLIGTGIPSSDLIFMLGGGFIKTNTVFRLIGTNGNAVLGSGENSNNPAGNVLRGPNASSSAVNTSGGSLTFQGGSSTGTAAGGNVYINGGTSASGTGGIFAVSTTAAERMRVDAAGNVGIATALPNQKLEIGGITNTARIDGIGSAGNFYTASTTAASSMMYANASGDIYSLPNTSSSILITNSSGIPLWSPSGNANGYFWSLKGNSGTPASSSAIGSSANNYFLGTTDAQDFVVVSKGFERMRVATAGNFGIQTTTPSALLDINTSAAANAFNVTTGNVVNITANALTAGTVLNVNSTGVITSGGSLASFTGNSMTTGNGINLSLAAMTTGNGINETANAITTGNAISVSSSSAGITTGSLLNLTSTGIISNSAGTLLDVNSSAANTAGYLVAITGNSTTASGLNIGMNAMTTGNGINLTANALTSGNGINVSSSSTAGLINGSSTLINIVRSGANTALAHTAYGISSSVTNTNLTSGTNIAGYFSASGAATANYGAEGITSSGAGIGLYGINSAASGTSTGIGVSGTTAQSLGYGVQGINSNAAGSAIYGNNSAVAGTGAGNGVYGQTLQSAGAGVYGIDNNSTLNQTGLTGVYGTYNTTSGYGVGVAGIGGSGTNGYTGQTYDIGVYGSAGTYGVWGNNNTTGNVFGVYGSISYAGTPGVDHAGAIQGISTAAIGNGNAAGIIGKTNQSQGPGVVGINLNTSATLAGPGVLGSSYSNGASPLVVFPTGGAGGSFTGNGVGAPNKVIIGVAGYANSGTTNLTSPGNNTYYSGGYFGCGVNSVTLTPSYYAYVGTLNNNTNYKITGTGTVATVVRDLQNKRVTMYCPEATEILLEDYGTAKLINGKVHIDLDPIFSKNIAVNEKHQLRVMITLNDQCNGVFVTNRTKNGFDVVELNNGNSAASFTYQIVANRADEYDIDGKTLLSKNQDLRFSPGAEPAPSSAYTSGNMNSKTNPKQ